MNDVRESSLEWTETTLFDAAAKDAAYAFGVGATALAAALTVLAF